MLLCLRRSGMDACFTRGVENWDPINPSRLVDVDILEPSESLCSGIGICCTSMGLGQQMVNWHWDWLRGDKLSLRLIRNHGEGISCSNLSQIKSNQIKFISSDYAHRNLIIKLRWQLKTRVSTKLYYLKSASSIQFSKIICIHSHKL